MSKSPQPLAFLFNPLTHWTVLAASLVFTLFAWLLFNSTVEKRYAERFDRQASDLALLIEKRMLGYETALRGGAGYFASQERVTREQWAIFIRSLKFEEAFPGILGIGFTRMLRAEEINTFVRDVRRSGPEDFQVYPEGLRDPVGVIEFLEPPSLRSTLALGYDQFSEPVRQKAMTHAMETGKTAISGPITLQGSGGKIEQRGFLMFYPVYRNNSAITNIEDRRTAIQGFVFAGFRFDELMEGIVGKRHFGVHFELYDGISASTDTLMYQSQWPTSSIPVADPHKHLFSRDIPLSISGKPWLIRVHANADFVDPQETLLPSIVGVSGLIINFLLFLTLTLLSRNREQLQQSLHARDSAIRSLQAAESELSHQENTLRNLMDSLSASVALIDREGNILRVNEAWRQFGGANGACEALSTGQRLNYFRTLEKAVADNAAGARVILENMQRLIHADIDSFSIDYPCHAAAAQRWFQLSVTRMQDAQGQYVIAHTDITAAYAAKAEISRYADMLDSCHTPILLLAADGSILSLNPAARSLLANTEHNALMVQIQNHLPTVISGTVLGLHLNIRTLESGERHLQLALSPHKEQGQRTSAVIVIHDVTELQQTQERLEIHQLHLEHIVNARTAELQASEDRLKTILETTAEGIIGTDASGTINFANPAAEQLLAYQPGKLLGLPMHETIHHHYGDGSAHSIDHCPIHISMSGGPEPYGVEDTFWCADGSRLNVSYSSRKIIQEGKILGCVVAFSNITDRKAADVARDIALSAAEYLAKVKSDFLANMSHEIRTPLNSVIASAMLMERDEATPRQRERLQRIVSSSQHLLRLINDILDFSKLEAGKIELERAEFDLKNILDNLYSQSIEQIRQKGLTWRTELDSRISPMLKGDALRIGQILLNFISNANKFTDQGEIVLSTRLVLEAGNSQQIRFAVTDTGRGFDPAKAQQLFQSFVQEDASTTRHYGGTGLGLAISKQLVELMGGTIGAESTPGGGSCFWFEIPLERGSSLRASAIAPVSLSGRRAIILTQNENIINRMRDQLAAQAITLQTAITPVEVALRVETAARIGRPYDFLFCAATTQDLKSLCEPSMQLRLRNPAMAHHPKFVHLHDLSTAAHNDPVHLNCFDGHLPQDFESSELEQLLAQLVSDPQLAESAELRKITDLSALSHYRILLVEDNPINQQVAMDMLNSVGLSAELADNGREAYILAENRRYDLILMDMQMPVMGGLDATREIRRLPEYADVPIIALTANAFESHRQECLKTGMNDFIAKPVDPGALYAKLQQWLPMQNRAAIPQASTPPATFSPRPLSGTNENDTKMPEIPGVNIHQGLTRLSGHASKYLRLLVQLVELHGNDHELIAKQLLSGDTVAARKTAHTLKGTAGMLCAEAVSAAALAIEKGIDEAMDSSEMSARLNTLGDTLTSIRQGLKQTDV